MAGFEPGSHVPQADATTTVPRLRGQHYKLILFQKEAGNRNCPTKLIDQFRILQIFFKLSQLA
jgi:hypothetical protein